VPASNIIKDHDNYMPKLKFGGNFDIGTINFQHFSFLSNQISSSKIYVMTILFADEQLYIFLGHPVYCIIKKKKPKGCYDRHHQLTVLAIYHQKN
jgi:hypothetical protein